MNTRNISLTLDNRKILRKRLGVSRECRDFNEANVLFNLSSAFANDRLSEYLQELTGRAREATHNVETGVVFGSLLEKSYIAGRKRDSNNFLSGILKFFERRTEIQARVLYEPIQLIGILDTLESKYAKTPEARAAKQSHQALRKAVNDLLFSIGDSLFEDYPNWFIEFVVLLSFEFDLNRKICGDDRSRVFSFAISLHYAYEVVSIDEKRNPTSIEFGKAMLNTEEKCFDLICAKRYPNFLPCRKSGCDGAYRYKIGGRRSLACDKEGCRDQLFPCSDTFFEARKGDLSDWFLGLLLLQRSSWISASDNWEKGQVKATLGRKRFDEVMSILANQQVRAYNDLHVPDMVRMPTTGLVVEHSVDGNSIRVTSFPANFDLKRKIKEPTILGFTIKK
jgi:hypothetical protein